MAASDLLLKDQSSTPVPFAPESTDQGTNAAGTAVKRPGFGLADGANVTLGAKADAVWDGAAAAPSLMAVMKAGVARLLGIGGTTVAVSGTVGLAGGNATAVKTDGSGVTQPVSGTVNLGTLNGAATDATLVAIKTALLAQVDLANLLVTDGTTFFVRREAVNEGTGTITVSFETMAGAAATPTVANLVPVNANGTRTVETVLFDATAGGTGYSSGDVIARVLVYDTAANNVVASYWHDLTSGAAIATAPSAANLVEQERGLPTGASKDTSLQSILAALQGLLKVDTVIPASAVDRGALTAVAGKTSSVTAGGSNYAQGDTITNAAGVFTVSAVTSGAVTAVTATTPVNFTTQPPSGALAQTATSGSGTGATLTPTFVPVAVLLAPANATRRYTAYQNQSSQSVWVSSIAQATADFHSLVIFGGDYTDTPAHHVGPGAIYVIGTTFGQPVYAREA